MPTYAYACTECDHTFDLVQSFSEDPLTICPQCEGRLRKVYGSIGVAFKGSGFYRTDSRSNTSRTGGSSASAGSDSSSGKADKGKADKGKGSSDGAGSASASSSSGATAAASS